ncbi:U3 small nucleolar RNA-associated protein [Dipsacomyces acuminosporus]|nr:U3 small nucleolar RNA-associated protein [Dipsacomyces acuminosporus]
MTNMQIHRCRFVDYVPQAINAIEFAPPTSTQSLLAVGRSNGDIEIWSSKKNLIYEKTIPGIKDGSLETLAWAHQTELTADDLELFDTEEEQKEAKKRLAASCPRLFSAGLTAVIVEWDLARLVPKAAVDSYGGAVWCMATNRAQTKLAVGTEDGHIRIFDLTDGKLAYERCFDKINSRILSVVWSSNDETIVTGSADGSVRIWNAKDGHMVTRMTVPKEGRYQTLVWAVTVLKDGTIVSGDSRGHVMFWDPAMYVVKQDFRALGADVLCLATDQAGHTVFASGVDPKITQFKQFVGGTPVSSLTENARAASKRKAPKWQLSGFRRYHTHDVRALAVSSDLAFNLLVSGGVDTQVASCESQPFPDDAPHRHPCFPPLNGVISIAPKANLVLQHQARTLKLWSLGKAEAISKSLSDQIESGQALQVYERQTDLLRMDLKIQSNLICSAISTSGHLVAASDADCPKLYHISGLDDGGKNVRARRIRSFPPADFVPEYSESRGATKMCFTEDESKIIIATADGFVSVIDISQWSTGQFATVRRHCAHRNTQSEAEEDGGCTDGIPTHPGVAKSQAEAQYGTRTITNIAVSKSCKHVATSDTTGAIAISNIGSKWQTMLPHLGSSRDNYGVTALEFTASGHLAITTSMNRLFVWDISSSRLTHWSSKYSRSEMPKKFRGMRDSVAGIATNKDEPDCLYLWAPSHITRVDLTVPPGPADSVINVHKRKQIEQEIIEKVVEEKEEAERRSERQLSKRNRKQRVGGDINGNSTLDVKTDASSAATANDQGEPGVVSKDWEATIIARLREAGINVEEPHNFRMTQRYQNLMHAAFVGSNTMVVVERPWIDVASSLPSAYHRHKYNGS